MIAIKQHVSLKPLNSLAIDSTARYFVDVVEPDQIHEALAFAEQHQLNTVVLAGGSNVVLADHIASLVIAMNCKGITLMESEEDSNDVYVTAAAGENWHHLVEFCLQQGFYGIENLALIPGSVGAAPIQNIGAYGVELVDVFQSLHGWHCQQHSWQTLGKQECQFGYRDSVFKHSLKGQFIISSVTLKLSRQPQPNTGYMALQLALQQQGISNPSPEQVAEQVISIRQSKLPDPSQLANAGSFFKNPVITAAQCDDLLQRFPQLVYYPQPDGQVKLAAGWLLEQAGWKGKRLGKVGMHQQQSLVLINYQQGSAAEVMALAAAVQQDIKQTFAIELEIEPALVS
jgi:UDP-N-acetylmuramate dehydrogenase